MQFVVSKHRNEDIWVDFCVLQSGDIVERIQNLLHRFNARILICPLV
jgi:hypothetical protein